MSAFGLNRYAAKFAVAVNDAGTRIADKPISCVDWLAFQLFEWGGSRNLDISFRFIYPFVGGTAVSNSFNLADPSAGRIGWEGTVTHSANGVTGDGVSGAGRTNVTLAGGTQADAFVMCGVYSRSATTGMYAEIGNYTSKTGILIYSRWTDGRASCWIGTGIGFAVANSQGLFSVLRAAANGLWIYRNGVLLASATTANVAINPPEPLIILANATDDPDVFQTFSNRNLAFAFLSNAANTPGIGPIFTTIKMAELYSHVQSFQTKLLRQV